MANYNVNDLKNNIYYAVPMWLYEGEYRKLTNNQRVIYSALLRRMNLSIENVTKKGLDTFVDENGDIYFYFDQEELSNEVCVSRKTANESIKSLMQIGLLVKVRQGQGKPNRMYLQKHNPEFLVTSNPCDCSDVTKSYIQKSKKVTSECNEKLHSDEQKSYTIYNNNKNINKDNIQFDSCHDYEVKRTELKTRMCYDDFAPIDQAKISDLVEILLSEVYYNTSSTIDLGNRSNPDIKPKELVLNQIDNNIGKGVILNYLDALKSINNTTISNPSRYLLKTIYQKCIAGCTQAQAHSYNY